MASVTEPATEPATPTTDPTTPRAPAARTPPRAESLDRLENELGVLLRRVRWVLAERARTTHPDISTPAYLLLGKLATDGPRRSSDLAEEFGIDKGAISRQVHQLCELGLVERTADPEDGRAQLIGISAQGRRGLEATHGQRRELLEGRLETWTGPELDEFVTALTRYNACLEGVQPASG